MSADVSTFPALLPAGERVLWQGTPCWRTLARRAFHIRKLAAYFAILLVWYAATVMASHVTLGEAAVMIGRMAGVALIPLALIGLYAWMTTRAAQYTITNRRVILRCGIAMPITFNLPFSKIDSADLRTWADGSGSIALTLTPPNRLAYLVLWPHAKPWRMARTEPMLRCIPHAERAAHILARALAAETDTPVQPSLERAPMPATRPSTTALA